MRSALLFLMLLAAAAPLAAKLYSVSWSVSPQEIFANQVYSLNLTFETDPGEEISEFRATQGVARDADRQTLEERNGRRYITFHWDEVSAVPKLTAIPEGEIRAMVTRTYVQGFFRSSQSYSAQTQVPAFQYTISKLPGEAEGLPVGSYRMTLAADDLLFRPGEVRELRVTLTALSGAIPEEVTFAVKEKDAGRLYPFRVISRDRTQCTAVARFVTERDEAFTLSLEPFRAFSPETRAVVPVTSNTLAFRVRAEQEEETADAVMIGAAGDRSLALRFSPAPGAPVIATVPAEGCIRKETYKGWVRLESPAGEGWIPEAHLKGLD